MRVRLVRPSQPPLAEAGEVVIDHPGGQETVALPTESMVHRLDGPPGDYGLQVDHVQAGSYLGAFLVLGMAPVGDLAAAGVTLLPA